jgi:hypothetical protein
VACSDELETAIIHFVAENNDQAKPFVWTANPKRILTAVQIREGKVRIDPLEPLYPLFDSAILLASHFTNALGQHKGQRECGQIRRQCPFNAAAVAFPAKPEQKNRRKTNRNEPT